MLQNSPHNVELREHCPGSAGLTEGLPKEERSEAADRGLKVHAAVAQVLRALGPGVTFGEVDALVAQAIDANGLAGPESKFDAESVRLAVRHFIKAVTEIEQRTSFEALRTDEEVKLNLILAGWPGIARADFLVPFADASEDYDAVRAVLVVELKTGVMAVSGPEANRQLHDYVVGAAVLHSDAEKVYGLILQPSIVDELQYRLAVWTRAEILGAGFHGGQPPLVVQLAQIRAATHNPNAPFVWGDHCSYCRAKEMCPARRGTITEARGILARSGSTVAEYMAKLEPAERLAEWKAAKQAKRYLEGFDNLVKAWLLNDPNASVPGYKVGIKPGNRQFSTERPAPQIAAEIFNLAAEELTAEGIDSPDKLVETISPTKVEEAIGAKAYRRLQEAGLVVKAEGGLSVLEDKAPAAPQPRKKS